MPDVPAVYFVSPTLANIRRIAQDLERCLYESFHLNFVEPLSRALLEELAAAVARDGTEELIEQVRIQYPERRFTLTMLILSHHQVLDQYLSFISPSPHLFSLIPPPPTASTSTVPTPIPTAPRSSYAVLNSPSSSEQEIEDEIERIATGLFSVVATSGVCCFAT
jgi:hypothetical protein